MKNRTLLLLFLLLCTVIITGCQQNQSIETVPVTITLDSESIQTNAIIGTSVQTVLAENNIILSQLDKVSPSLFSHITQKTDIIITRVTEEFEKEEIIIPFERQTIRNESLPEKQTILIQPGVNGLREITYRSVLEDGELLSKTEISRTDIIVSNPEIIMVGVQNPFSPVTIYGKIAYLSSGNAWIMDGDTANRRPIVTNSKLDGRVLEISPDGEWLLFSQLSEDPELINELYIINLEEENAEPIYIRVDNVIHYAEWAPGFNLAVAYSTVEPRTTAPGWQANNDLIITTLGAGGRVIKAETIIESNSGGIYGWWGSTYAFSPNGRYLAYARPDSIGLVDQEENELVPLVQLVPFQTRSEWAWITPFSWSADSNYLYYVDHNTEGFQDDPESANRFDLHAINVESEIQLYTANNIGMFGMPVTMDLSAINRYKLLFLKAIFPENSDTSRYRLFVSDRDGSNLTQVFPEDNLPGVDPQKIEWGPCEIDNTSCYFGIVYQGNIWLINGMNYNTTQITGDGLITKIDWK